MSTHSPHEEKMMMMTDDDLLDKTILEAIRRNRNSGGSGIESKVIASESAQEAAEVGDDSSSNLGVISSSYEQSSLYNLPTSYSSQEMLKINISGGELGNELGRKELSVLPQIEFTQVSYYRGIEAGGRRVEYFSGGF